MLSNVNENITAESFAMIKSEPDNLYPRPTTDKEALDILRIYFLGKDWYSFSQSNDQYNTELVYAILKKYKGKDKKEKSLLWKILNWF